jgi:hypothetical protein
VSLDGSTLEVADEQENVQAFGRPAASRGASAYPQIRFVALVENGTHVLFGSRLGGMGDGRDHPGPGDDRGSAAGDAVLGRPQLLWLGVVESSPGPGEPTCSGGW